MLGLRFDVGASASPRVKLWPAVATLVAATLVAPTANAQPAPVPAPPSASPAATAPPEALFAQPQPYSAGAQAPQGVPPQPGAQPYPPGAQPYPPSAPPQAAPAADEPEEEEEPRRRKRTPRRSSRPPKLAWRPGEAVPPGYTPESGPNKKLLIGGLVSFGTLYLASTITGYVTTIAGDGGAFGPMFIPVVGPFVTIATAEAEGVGTYLLALDGVGQAVGATLFCLSFPVHDHWLERQDGPQPTVSLGPGQVSLRVEF